MSNKNQNVIVVRALLTREDKVLVVRRSQGQSRPGMWELPGGKVEANEDLETSLRREVKEEVGYDIADWTYLSSDAYNVNDSQRLGVLFTAEVGSAEPILNPESDAYQWVDASSYHNISFEDFYKDLLDGYFITDEGISENYMDVAHDTTKVDTLIIYTDGGSRGNPGPSASGFVIMDSGENVLEDGGEYLGITTNNQAEYQAVRQALDAAKKYGRVNIEFYIDSLLVVNQMNGTYQIRNRDLWPIHERITELAKEFRSVTYTHVRREFNSLADAKVNQVLDAVAGNA